MLRKTQALIYEDQKIELVVVFDPIQQILSAHLLQDGSPNQYAFSFLPAKTLGAEPSLLELEAFKLRAYDDVSKKEGKIPFSETKWTPAA